MSGKHIAKVIRFDNGMVMVFDDDGQQMTEYQGKFEDVHLAIDKAAFQFSNS
jgi:hypothetical protein